MNKLYHDLKKYHNYSDYQIRLVQYVLKTLASELSKFLIIGIFFLIAGKFTQFLFAAALLLFFRRYNGGLHCKTYVTCLLTTFLFFFSSIIALPEMIHVPLQAAIAVWTGLTIWIPVTAPVKSVYHARLLPEQVRKYRIWTLIVMAILTILYSCFPDNALLIISFWIATTHAAQLTAAKYRNMKREQEVTL